MKLLAGWVLALGMLGGPGAKAPVLPDDQAQLYPVAATGAAARFQVPQVRLPNTGVARRINQQLLRYVTAEFSSVDSVASPPRQLYQAARECCYDEDLKRWRAGGDGLTVITYAVLLNQNYLLSLEFRNEYQG